jgi:uncharacterized protein (DUF433 family)
MVALAQTNQYLGVGVYTKAEAAKLTGIESRRIARWIQGYTFHHGGEVYDSQPVWVRELPDLDQETLLSFRDLVEVRFVDAFRQHGVSLQLIKKVAEKAAAKFHRSHPFGSLGFRTDGRTIFAEVAEETGEQVLIDLRDDQQAFPKILQPYLYEGLEFSSEQVLRWRPVSGEGKIVLDPKRALGKPITDAESVPTQVLYQAYLAEDSVEAVADWYEVSRDSVKCAIGFEESLLP